jgi:DNA helicase-2/ATP-dependent DNA helicase PcrA
MPPGLARPTRFLRAARFMSALVALVDVHLDDAQRRVVDLPAGRAVLVLGEAGHGKTTVALHRLGRLVRSRRGATARFRAAVVVPTDGLRALVERALVRLGLDVPALTYDRFARRQARRAFADLPRRESRDTTPATVRLKRDPGLARAIETIAEGPPGRIDEDADAWDAATPSSRAVRGDLQHLFGDRALLERAIEHSGGRLPRHAIAETLDHTRVQFGLTGEQAWAHVEDRKRLVPVDRRSLDEGTPDADAASIDAEDYAILFAIDRARAARDRVRPTRPRAFDCLVIDEAQGLAPIELALLGRSLARGGTLIVAGDADQQLDADGYFGGWPETMRALGRADYDSVLLDVSYRCAPAVVALAKRALGREPMPADAPSVTRFTSSSERAAWLVQTLERMGAEDEHASIAVLTRTPLAARRIAEELRKTISVRLVWGGDFCFAPGIDVTTIDQVRGLEFDHVIVADVSSSAYGDDAASRRAMYVAITRARTSVRLASVGPPSTIFVADE